MFRHINRLINLVVIPRVAIAFEKLWCCHSHESVTRRRISWVILVSYKCFKPSTPGPSRRYWSISAAGEGAQQHSKCEQCLIVSWRRKLQTDFLLLLPVCTHIRWCGYIWGGWFRAVQLWQRCSVVVCWQSTSDSGVLRDVLCTDHHTRKVNKPVNSKS